MTRRSLLVMLLGLSSGGEAWAQFKKPKGKAKEKEKESEPEKGTKGLDEVPTKAKWYFDDLLKVATIVNLKHESKENRLVFLCTSKVPTLPDWRDWSLVCYDEDEVRIYDQRTTIRPEPMYNVRRGERFRLYVPLPPASDLGRAVEIRLLNLIDARGKGS